jgi:hypothetical protein
LSEQVQDPESESGYPGLIVLAGQLIPLAAVLAVVSYALGRFYTESYYSEAGIPTTNLGFSNQDYALASIEILIFGTILILTGFLTVKFRLMALPYFYLRPERDELAFLPSVVVFFGFIFALFTGFGFLQPSSTFLPGIWGLLTGLSVGLMAAAALTILPLIAEIVLFIGHSVTHSKPPILIAKIIWHGSLSGLFSIAKRLLQHHRIIPFVADISPAITALRKSILHRRQMKQYGQQSHANTPEWVSVTKLVHERPVYSMYLTIIVLSLLIIVMPFASRQLAKNDFQRDIRDGLPLSTLTSGGNTVLSNQESILLSAQTHGLPLIGCAPTIAENTVRIVLETEDLLFFLDAREIEIRQCIWRNIREGGESDRTNAQGLALRKLEEQVPLTVTGVQSSTLDTRVHSVNPF